MDPEAGGSWPLSHPKLLEEKALRELPKWFPKTMEDVYRPEVPGRSIDDPRVAESHGGGACPEQHWGTLTDGRRFYFRYRSAWASVRLAPAWFDGEIIARDLRVTREQWDEAYERGDEELPNLWLGPGAGFQVRENDPYHGWFDNAEERALAFAACLDQIWDEPFDEEGWELHRGRKEEDD